MISTEYLVQGIGLLASALVITSFAQKSDMRFKVFVMIGAFVFAGHFLLLGAYSGAIVAIINGARTGFSMKFHNSNYILGAFLILYVLAGVLVYEKPLDVLPIFSGSISTVALYKLSGIKLRVVFLFTESGWIVYSIIMKSLGGLITNVFVLGTNAVTTYRLLKDKKAVEHD